MNSVPQAPAVFSKETIRAFPDADTSNIRCKYLEIPYAQESEFQSFDLYLPEDGEGPFPLVIFMHGGGWCRGDKRDIQVRGFLKLLDKGYAIASVNYRMSFEAVFPACLQDCREAVRYIKAHAGEWRIDPECIAAAGDSAGGHLALLLALAREEPMKEYAVRCAVALFPVTDVRNTSKANLDNPLTPEGRLLGGAISQLSAEYVAGACPVSYISEEMPPLLLQHGRIDFTLPCVQSLDFYEKTKIIVKDDRVELDIIENAVHMDSWFESDKNMDRIEHFLNKHMR